MRIVSGSMKHENVNYIAPPASALQNEMSIFLDWFNTPAENQNLNNVIKSAIAHLYFVSIHPFEDGNGRLGRAIADMALCKNQEETGYPYPIDHLYSMSAQLCKERKDYYAHLAEAQSGNLNITNWILWYLGCMNRAVESVLDELAQVRRRQEFWHQIENLPTAINERQRKILDLCLKGFEGKLTSSKYAKICKCSQDTASRDLEKLTALGIIAKSDAGGRSTSYYLP